MKKGQSPASALLCDRASGGQVREFIREKLGQISAPIALIAGLIGLFVIVYGLIEITRVGWLTGKGQVGTTGILTAIIGVLLWRYSPIKTFGLFVLGAGATAFLISLTLVGGWI